MFQIYQSQNYILTDCINFFFLGQAKSTTARDGVECICWTRSIHKLIRMGVFPYFSQINNHVFVVSQSITIFLIIFTIANTNSSITFHTLIGAEHLFTAFCFIGIRWESNCQDHSSSAEIIIKSDTTTTTTQKWWSNIFSLKSF